jgi:MFS family permease
MASAGNLGGLALGPLLSGVLAQYAPLPLRVSYVVYLVLLAGVVAIVRITPETVERPARRLGDVSLRPRIGVPRGIRLAFGGAAAMAFAAFALGGFYAALVPGLLTQTMHETRVVIGGVIVAAFFGSGSATVFVTRTLRSRAAMIWALGFLLAGLAALLLAEAEHSGILIVVATVLTGAAMALGYRSSLQRVNEIAPADRRAEVLSSYLAACYTGNALPIIGVGGLSLLVAPSTAHWIFAAVLAVLGAAACVLGAGRVRNGERPRSGQSLATSPHTLASRS